MQFSAAVLGDGFEPGWTSGCCNFATLVPQRCVGQSQMAGFEPTLRALVRAMLGSVDPFGSGWWIGAEHLAAFMG